MIKEGYPSRKGLKHLSEGHFEPRIPGKTICSMWLTRPMCIEPRNDDNMDRGLRT